MAWPRVESTITIGNLLVAASFFLGGIAAYTDTMVRMNEFGLRLAHLERAVVHMETIARDLTKVQQDVAVIAVRLQLQNGKSKAEK